MNITKQELDKLKSAMSIKEWVEIEKEIIEAHGGDKPDDWYEKVTDKSLFSKMICRIPSLLNEKQCINSQ